MVAVTKISGSLQEQTDDAGAQQVYRTLKRMCDCDSVLSVVGGNGVKVGILSLSINDIGDVVDIVHELLKYETHRTRTSSRESIRSAITKYEYDVLPVAEVAATHTDAYAGRRPRSPAYLSSLRCARSVLQARPPPRAARPPTTAPLRPPRLTPRWRRPGSGDLES